MKITRSFVPAMLFPEDQALNKTELNCAIFAIISFFMF
nr:MAG TPA: hypothetical protein [Caudoviricetes sp.]